MGNTCSYIYNGNLQRNQACYAIFRTKFDSMIVVIEENKALKHFTKDQVLRYLKDLKLYFDFDIIEQDNTEIHVNISRIEHSQRRIALCMAIRLLWEGTSDYDSFYIALKAYFQLRTHFPKLNKFRLLMVAANYYIAVSTT